MIFTRLRPVALTVFLFLISTLSSAEDFDNWRAGLAAEAKEAGISAETIQATLSHIELLPNVVSLDRAQPEFISTFMEYYGKRVNAKKLARGRELLLAYEPLLNDLEQQYGVPGSVLIAFWGMETNFGSFKGNVDTFSTLTTLANDGRRATFFRNQLLDAMRLADDGHVAIGDLRGSWAGAFGHMQFMPSTMLVYGMDGDGDQRIDLMNSIEDALTSAANYLSQAGWLPNEPAILEVQLPSSFPWQEAGLKYKAPLAYWQAKEVKLASSNAIDEIAQSDSDPSKIAATQIKNTEIAVSNNSATSAVNQPKPLPASTSSTILNDKKSPKKWPVVEGQAKVLLPQGWRGPAFMAFDNFDVIMEWNRSVNYALSVAQFALELEGGPGILGGKFAEIGSLTFAQMFELQNGLNTLGFDAGKPDGFPGLQTQAALREYQIKNQLPADGFANLSIYAHVMQKIQPKQELQNPITEILE